MAVVSDPRVESSKDSETQPTGPGQAGFPMFVNFLPAISEKGHVKMDIGANIGYLTLFLRRCAGPQVAVFAFEPEPNNLAELACTIERAIISTGVCPATLPVAPIQPESAGPPNCHMVSLDSFVAERGITKVDFVKIDAGGFEADVLLGRSRIIERVQ